MKEITAAEFQQEVQAAPGRVLVDFYTPDCNPCRQMAPVLAELEQESGGALKVVKVDAGVEAALASAWRVQAVPTLLLFQNGECRGQVVGARSKKALQTWLQETR